MFDFYRCINGGAAPTTGIPTTCDNTWAASTLMIHSYEKTVNVKFYDKPINNVHRELDRIIPMVGLRYEADITVKWVDLYTDVGAIAKDWQLERLPSMLSYTKSAGEKSMANIAKNYLSQGRVIMADFEYHLEITSSNDKTEIYRYYYTIIDVFAAVGGLLQF